MKTKIICLFLWFLFLFPQISSADQDDWSIPVTSTISTSFAINADLVADFGPSASDMRLGRSVKFMIMVTPATAAAIVQMQCTQWNSPTSALVATTLNINGGTSLTAGAGFDFDFLMSPLDGVCNLQATSGGTQLWTVTVKKSINGNR